MINDKNLPIGGEAPKESQAPVLSQPVVQEQQSPLPTQATGPVTQTFPQQPLQQGAPSMQQFQQPLQQQQNPEPAAPVSAPGWDPIENVISGDITDFMIDGLSPLSVMADNELLSKLSKALREAMTKDGQAIKDYSVLHLDQNTHRTPVSALIVVKHNANTKKVHVATILLETSAARIGLESFTYQAQTYELVVTADQLWSDDFWNTIAKTVKANYASSTAETEVFDCGAVVLPRDFDPENVNAVHTLASHVTGNLAIRSHLAEGKKLKPLNLAGLMAGKQFQLSSRIDFNGDTRPDAIGRAVRSDVTVGMLLQQATQYDNWGRPIQNQRNTPSQLTSLSGFVDAQFVGPTAQTVTTPMGAQSVIGTQAFLADFVITDIGVNFRDLTQEKFFLAVANAFAMDRDGAWALSFLPRATRNGEKNLRDVGVLGLDYDPTQTGNFQHVTGATGGLMNLDELSAFMQTYFYRSLTISIDVDPTGLTNHVMSDLIRLAVAANGAPEKDAAALRVLNSINQLTNGQFSTLWSGGAHEVVEMVRHINLGSYTAADGTRRDVRDIDYIGIQNATTDRVLVAKWQDTLDARKQLPWQVALATQQSIIRQLYPSAEFHGVGYRLRFTQKLLNTLAKSMAQAGLTPRPDNQQMSAWGNVVDRNNAALLSNAVSNLGNVVYNFQPNNNMYGLSQGGIRLGGFGY